MTIVSEFELLSPSDLRERDVDLLLREELYVSEDFQRFFLSLLGERFRGAELVSVRHSVDRHEGESDLEIDLDNSGRPIRLLVEDKIDAQFQKGQAERYNNAGAHYINSLKCSEFLTVLIAPKSYLADSTHGFHQAIELEKILNWFQSDSSPRYRYKASLLRSIIDKVEADRPKDPKITQFWEGYFDLANQTAKGLGMRRPGGRSGGFLFFSPPDIPRYLSLVHKLSRGYVDLQFAMLKPSFDDFSGRVRGIKSEEMQFRKTGESVSVSIYVGELDTSQEFSSQIEGAKRGITAAARLWDWFKMNRTSLESVYLSLVKSA